jgi:uncharacterized damage-inducible protein DinB
MNPDAWKESLRKGLEGAEAHLPLARILGVDPGEAADRRWPGMPNTARECLYHILVWAQVMTASLANDPKEWPRDLAATWQVPGEFRGSAGWRTMAERLLDTVERASTLLERLEPADPVPSWPKSTLGWTYQALIIHNAYHLGQLVALLRLAGAWPLTPEA